MKKIAKEKGLLWAGGVSYTPCYENGGSKEEVQELFRNQPKIFVEHDADLLIAEVNNRLIVFNVSLSYETPSSSSVSLDPPCLSLSLTLSVTLSVSVCLSA